ncbi:MAG TPA: hypothetical protein VJ692_04645 [Nitrospiraceae bacterium]|nr:hypothetical protein [Nitrospiraceae bacterium]
MRTSKTDVVRLADQSAMATRDIESGSMCSEGTILNWVRGVIHSQHVGLLRSGVRIKVGTRSDVRVRWVKREARRFVVGQPVVAMIPAGAVRLESGMFRRSKQRWNRWVGRIVLIEHLEAHIVYTVKVHGEEWTVKSLGPVLGAQQRSKPWDVVNVVVDPQVVELSIAAPCLMRLT